MRKSATARRTLSRPPRTSRTAARINAGIATDPDNPELDDGWPERARPAIELRPRLVKRWATRRYLRTGDSSKLRAIGMWPLDVRKLKEISDDSVLDGLWLSDDPVGHRDGDVTGKTTHDSVGSGGDGVLIAPRESARAHAARGRPRSR